MQAVDDIVAGCLTRLEELHAVGVEREGREQKPLFT